MTSLKSGQCLCGKVKIEAKAASDKVGACHCGTCRRQSGGPFMSVECGQDIKLEGEQHISCYNSSEWADRSFCNSCGTFLFYRLKQQGLHFVSAGLFKESFHFDHQVFIDEKPEYYEFANKTENMTGPEIFAKFS